MKKRGRKPGTIPQPHWKKPGRKPKRQNIQNDNESETSKLDAQDDAVSSEIVNFVQEIQL